MIKFWFILSFTFIFIELFNPGLFFFLALALGAVATMLAQLYQCLPFNQFAFFFTSSGILFGLLQLFVKFMLKQKPTKQYRSNLDLLVGKTVTITQITSDSMGYTTLGGDFWHVKLHNSHEKLHIGMSCLVVGIKGCHLQIVPIK